MFINKQTWMSFLSSQVRVVYEQLSSFTALISRGYSHSIRHNNSTCTCTCERALSLSLSLSNIFLHSYTSRLGIPSKQSRKRAWSSQENGLDIIIIIKFYILTKKRSNILFNFLVHCTLMTYWRKFEWLWFVPFFKI